ncbi:hypothetical protein [Legionella cincinnatiensis]|uniref:Uncharacterized protein n=1 Tax=Legionella cincinnatiensis TaxID=28085 RepID=A0A378IFL7_9GAMM|nr:hypothetical protein [Legionella cincinnatiensis]KTC92161.1 hypothetical protein Lcin_0940 [Legionella cincinnatiensis]STX33535.1 Uncharacterised protein [Legionella cincinnatiensis]
MLFPDMDLNNIQQRGGETQLINAATAKKDGFRLYICTPVPYRKNEEEEKELKPEIRFKANKTIDGLHIHEEIKKKNSAFCFQIIMNIVNQVLFSDVQIKKKRHTVFINKLWDGLNDTHKKEIIRTIYERKPFLLSKKASVYHAVIGGNNTQEFFNLLCQNHPLAYPNTVEPQNASQVIYITNKDLTSKEGIESISLYIQKHPNQCCIVTKKNALEQVLNHHHNENQTITLVIFGHNNINKKKEFLDWTLETAGRELGKLLNKYLCIGHLNMFTCHSISLNSAKLNNAMFYEKSTGKQDLSRSLSVYPQSALPEDNPFTTATLAYQIHQVVSPNIHTQERGPLTMTFSPVYILVKNNQFIGTSHEHKYSFNEKDPLLHYKKITTFVGNEHLFNGVCLSKSNHHKTSRHRAILKNNEIIPQTSLSSPHTFFKLLSKSENDGCRQSKKQVYSQNISNHSCMLQYKS